MNPHPIDPQQTETPNSRQRFLDTLKFKPVTKPWMRWGAFLWEETVERWKQEGWDGTPLDDLFELDRLVRVDPWYGPVPEFRHEVLSEDAETVTYVNHEGIGSGSRFRSGCPCKAGPDLLCPALCEGKVAAPARGFPQAVVAEW